MKYIESLGIPRTDPRRVIGNRSPTRVKHVYVIRILFQILYFYSTIF